MCVKGKATTQSTVQDKRQWRKSLNVTVVLVLHGGTVMQLFSSLFLFSKMCLTNMFYSHNKGEERI